MKMTPSPTWILGLTALTIAMASARAQGIVAQHGEIVLASSQTPPGSGGAATDFPVGAVIATSNSSSFFQTPSIDLNGTLVFRARCADDAGLGISAGNGWAFYQGRTNADLRMIVRGGDQAPGLATGILLRGSAATTNGLGSMRISPLNEILLFGSTLNDGGVNVTTANDTALFWGVPGGFQVLAREGDLVPTLTNGEVYAGLPTTSNQDFWINATGQSLFRANLVQTGTVTASNDYLVMRGAPGTLQVFLREGDLWTGTGAAGEVLDRFSSNVQSPAGYLNMNEAGMILHDLHFLVPSGSATSTANDRAVAIWDGTTDVIVAREGDQAPGMPVGALFADASAFVGFGSLQQNGFNKSTQFVILSTPVGGGVTTADDNCMFMGSLTSPLTLVLREGDPAPASMGPGVLFGTVNSTVQLNDKGQLAFFATVTGTGVTSANDQCLFTGTPGNWTLVAREGDAAPGLPGFFLGSVSAGTVMLDEHGDIVFGSNTVTDNGAPAITRSTYWCWTEQNGLRLFFDPIDSMAFPLGATTLANGYNSSGSIQSGDSGSVMFGANGDAAIVVTSNSAEAPAKGFAVVRAHVGSLVGKPSAVPVGGGTPHLLDIDVGPNYGLQFYLVLATSMGTRPGFPHPFNGALNTPLNYDPLWTQLSFSAFNSSMWVNTLGITDLAGKGVAAFNMPAGYPGFMGTTLHHAAIIVDFSIFGTFVTEPSAVKLY